jgi:hypothetical protein
MRTLLRILGSAALTLVLCSTLVVTSDAQAHRPYKDGPVVNVSSVRTLPGQYDNYMLYLYGDYAKLMEAQKAAGMITAWSVLRAQPQHPDDPDVFLTVTYPNMAALDNLRDRTDPIAQKVLNHSPEQSAAANAQRGQMRRAIGSQLLWTVVANP